MVLKNSYKSCGKSPKFTILNSYCLRLCWDVIEWPGHSSLICFVYKMKSLKAEVCECFLIGTQARGDLPLNKFRFAWDSVNFSDSCLKEETSALLADTIAHMGQEVTSYSIFSLFASRLWAKVWIFQRLIQGFLLQLAVNGDFKIQLIDLVISCEGLSVFIACAWDSYSFFVKLIGPQGLTI